MEEKQKCVFSSNYWTKNSLEFYTYFRNLAKPLMAVTALNSQN
jgi:hypothetical protein